MSFFDSIIKDLREKRLWPVAVVLLAGLVAVPVLLSKSAAKVTVAAVPHGSLAGSALPSKALPVVTVTPLTSHERITGRARNPFVQQKGSSSTSSTSTTTNVAATTTAVPAARRPAAPVARPPAVPAGRPPVAPEARPAGGTGGTTTGGGTTPIHTGKPKPAPTGLTSDESYDVTISITNTHGGVNKIGSLERLGTLPDNQTPMLVQLGVLKGGHRVLFAVQRGTVLHGPGTCTPGPIDCEVLSLGQDQIESIARNTTNGLGPVSMFAVTGITASHYRSASAAGKARSKVSAVGRRLLEHSSSSALSLFPYKPGLGAIVDLRDLTIGGKLMRRALIIIVLASRLAAGPGRRRPGAGAERRGLRARRCGDPAGHADPDRERKLPGPVAVHRPRRTDPARRLACASTPAAPSCMARRRSRSRGIRSPSRLG